jgi:NADH-quinone oxidoreductase subunit L
MTNLITLPSTTAIMVAAILGLPLLGFVVNFSGRRCIPKMIAGGLAAGTVLIAFLLSSVLFYKQLTGGDAVGAQIIHLADWFADDKLKVSFQFLIDRLSLLMMLIVTGVGFLIHVYSIGYMHDDEEFNRFFAYMNLFIFFMSMLVLGANYLILFIGWEGVGLCSYFLIGFWYRHHAFNDAAKKAFIMDRIGDLGMLLGLFLMIKTFGSIDYATVFSRAQTFTPGAPILVAIALLLFFAATGKSAQIPLFTWLPDAMAGPTPVSALIHAATMVTAGIYLVARSHVIFSLAPQALQVMLIVGVATSLLAAMIAMAQNDIKKVLAYSTVSQLGFMVVALGLGAYTTAIFHLTTHAFFKALLFLGAGSVIHAMRGEQDIQRMGGLRASLPITYWTFLLATAAISGIPPLAGFFSKDEIIAIAFGHNPIAGAMIVGISLLTAFYMFRLFFLTFWGENRSAPEIKAHLHESPKVMTVPLMVLAILSCAGGFIGVPALMGGNHWLQNWLKPVTPAAHVHLSHSIEWALMGGTLVLIVGVILFCRKKYAGATPAPTEAEVSPNLIVHWATHKFYVDEIYDVLIIKPVRLLSQFLTAVVDRGILDGLVNWMGRLPGGLGSQLRYAQSGSQGFYLFIMALGALIFLAIQVFS